MAEVSVIVWSNDDQLTEGLCIPSLTPPYQRGPHDVQAIIVHPQGRAKNMGQAYNGGASLATFPIRIFVHQDVVMEDRDYLTKLASMLEDERIGLVGIVGATIDTGASFFQAPVEYKVGEVPEMWVSHNEPGSFFDKVHGLQTAWATRFHPERKQVKVLDCLMFATNMNLRFAECYEKTHMVAEDYCMRVRRAGKQVWTVDSLVEHFSFGTIDDSYWRSVAIFRKRWARMLPADLPTLDKYKGLYLRKHKETPGWETAWRPEQLALQGASA